MRRSQALPEDGAINEQVNVASDAPKLDAIPVLQDRPVARPAVKGFPSDFADINGIGALLEVQNFEPTVLVSKDNVFAGSRFNFVPSTYEFSWLNPIISGFPNQFVVSTEAVDIVISATADQSVSALRPFNQLR